MPYREPDELEKLPPPYELLDMVDGQTVALRIERHAQGWMMIRPRGAPADKKVSALRVWLKAGEKTAGPSFWDITAKHLHADLIAWLEGPGPKGRVFWVTKVGPSLTGRHSIRVVPE